MPNKALLKFIKEARERGFDDYQIREPLIKHSWPLEEIEKAFNFLKPKYKYKNKVNIFLDNEVLKKLEKRAEKNMFTLPEQIEDILRRSILSQKKSTQEEKLDDKFLAYFSRRK